MTRNGYITMAIVVAVLLAFGLSSMGAWELLALAAACGLIIVLANLRRNHGRDDP